MPRKRWLTRLSYYSVIKPEDGDEVDDYDLVRATLADFEELADLPTATREQLVADLVGAIRFWRAGVKPESAASRMRRKRNTFSSRMSDVPWNGPVYPQRGGVRRMRAMVPILTHQRAFSSVWRGDLLMPSVEPSLRTSS